MLSSPAQNWARPNQWVSEPSERVAKRQLGAKGQAELSERQQSAAQGRQSESGSNQHEPGFTFQGKEIESEKHDWSHPSREASLINNQRLNGHTITCVVDNLQAA